METNWRRHDEQAVQKQDAWRQLVALFEQEEMLTLRDYDGYDYSAKNMSLTDVLNNPTKKMGHAFVLAMLLLDDPALKQMEMRN